MTNNYKLGDKFILTYSESVFTVDGIENNTYYGYLENTEGVYKRTLFSFGELERHIKTSAMKKII